MKFKLSRVRVAKKRIRKLLKVSKWNQMMKAKNKSQLYITSVNFVI